jgi:release factor glutamine methyltransferase
METTTVLSEIRQQFRSGLSGYYPDAEISQIFLLASEHVLNYSKIDTFLKADQPISDETLLKFEEILNRLKKWEPIQYIFGTAWFYGLTFEVDRHVLIPRQETEELVHWIINSEPKNQCRIVDLATGSGCIAISLAVNMKNTVVSACDFSSGALAVARKNAGLNKASVEFFSFDLLNDNDTFPGKYQVMVSNPPYVTPEEIVLMKKNVLDYEPHMALFVPDHDPLVFYKRIALLARKNLLDGGSLYLEINEKFPDEVSSLLKSAGLYAVEVRKDLNGKFRMIKAKK